MKNSSIIRRQFVLTYALLFILLSLSGKISAQVTGNETAVLTLYFYEPAYTTYTDYTVSFRNSLTGVSEEGGSVSDSGGKLRLKVNRGAEKAVYTFTPGGNVTELRLIPSTTPCTAIRKVELSGFTDGLNSIYVDNNAIDEPIQVPAGCSVYYGDQYAVDIRKLGGNILDVGKYDNEGWSIKWTYRSNNQDIEIPENIVEYLGDGLYFFNRNLDYRIRGLFTHASGLRLFTQFFDINEAMTPVVSFTCNGSGTKQEIGFSKSETYNGSLIIQCGRDIKSTNTSDVLQIPDLKNFKGTKVIYANSVDAIKSLTLNDLGITEIKFLETLGNLVDINLSGNALMPSGLPDDLKKVSGVDLSNQNDFQLHLSESPFTFDLSKEISSGAEVEWLDYNDNIISPNSYREDRGVYTFVKDVGRVRVRLTSTYYPSYLAYSNFVDIDFNYLPFCEFDWAKDSGAPAVIQIETNEDNFVKFIYGADEDKEELTGNSTTSFRLKGNKGHVILASTNSLSINKLVLADIGISNLSFTDQAKNIKFIDLSGNKISPLNLPDNVPSDCCIEWGEMGPLDIEPYLQGSNIIDLYDFRQFEIAWYFLDGKSVPASLYTESTKYYVFENVGKVYAILSRSDYPDLEIPTTIVDFSDIYFDLLRFVCATIPDNSGSVILNQPGKIKVNNQILTSDSEGCIALTLNELPKTETDGSQGYGFTLSSPFPHEVCELMLSGLNINSITLGEGLENLSDIDLRYNRLMFKTFPLVENCNVLLGEQEPVDMSVDSETGIVEFPDFMECNTIKVCNTSGSPVTENFYSIDPSHAKLQFKGTVYDAIIVFSDHPRFPGVSISSVPLTFVSTSAIGLIGESGLFNLTGNYLDLYGSNPGYLYNLQGVLLKIIQPGESLFLENGMYIFIIDDNNVFKIKI